MPKRVNRSNHSDEIIERYEAIIACVPDLEWKGKANPYTSLNGHMFSFIDGTGTLSLRFSKEDQEAFIKKYKTGPSIQYSAVMNGYALVPDSLFKNVEKMTPYFLKSYEFVKSLPPKTSKKK